VLLCHAPPHAVRTPRSFSAVARAADGCDRSVIVRGSDTCERIDACSASAGRRYRQIALPVTEFRQAIARPRA
jgi:hypothetical protein